MPDSLNNMVVTVDDEGSKCSKDTLPLFLGEENACLPQHATIKNVLANWDECAAQKTTGKTKFHVDLCDCLLPNDQRSDGHSQCRKIHNKTI